MRTEIQKVQHFAMVGQAFRPDLGYKSHSDCLVRQECPTYCCNCPGPQSYGSGGEICLWSSSDNGRTWIRQGQVTRNSPRNHNYVRRPLNARDLFFAFWADGDPPKLSESRLYFCDSTGKHGWPLPCDVSAEAVKPEPISK